MVVLRTLNGLIDKQKPFSSEYFLWYKADPETYEPAEKGACPWEEECYELLMEKALSRVKVSS